MPSMKFSIPKPKALFAKILWRKESAHMAIGASLLMDLLSLNATQTNKCLIKLDPAMHLQEKVTAHMDLVAIFCIAIKISMSNQVRC